MIDLNKIVADGYITENSPGMFQQLKFLAEKLIAIDKICLENIDVDRSMTSMREEIGLNFADSLAQEIRVYSKCDKAN